MRAFAGVLLLLIFGAAAWVIARPISVTPGDSSAASRGVDAQLSLRGLLGPSAQGRQSDPAAAAHAGFSRALAVRPFEFPADHGPHPRFRSEWWYVTGNLADSDHREFGFQLTFFRFALAPQSQRPTAKPAPWTSAWRSSQVFMGHFAISDVGAQRFYSAERMQRDALGLAGAVAAPFRVWLGGWEMAAASAQPGIFPLHLRAQEREFGMNLELGAGKPLILNGDRGLSQKSSEPGNASYYYSYSRLPAHGSVRVGADTYQVAGQAWIDREWSTSALSPAQTGWDWFALQLADGTELMLYQLRRADGSIDSASSGTWVGPQGKTVLLGAGDVRVEVLSHWSSNVDGKRYPSSWRVSVPKASLQLTVEPKLKDQEMRHSVRYWEGAVRALGESQGQVVTGEGYVELTGY